LTLKEGDDVLRGGECHATAGLGGGGAEVWREDDVGALEAGVNERFLFKDVEAGAGNFFGFEGVDESGFVYYGTARSVDEEGGRLHAEEFGRVEELASVGIERDVQRDEVGFGEERVHVAVYGVKLLFDVFGDALAAVIDDFHAEALRATGNSLADAAEADDAERFPPDIGAAVLIEVPALPVPCPDILIAFDDTASDGEHERPGEVGGGFVEDAGGIGDQDAAAGAGGNVHVVVTDGNVSDDAELRRGAEGVVADSLGEKTDETFFIFDAAEQFVFGRTLLLGPEFAVADGLEEGLRFRVERMCDEDFGFRHVGSCKGKVKKYGSTSGARIEGFAAGSHRITIVARSGDW
jgi:hypothetical protein